MRADPTRTLSIARRFVSDIRRRTKALQRAIRKWLDTDDELGLKSRTTLIRLQREFEFATSEAKLGAFNSWFAGQVEQGFFGVPSTTDPTRPWTSTYTDSAYRKGQVNAFLSTRQAQLFEELGVGDQTLTEFLRSSFSAPETTSKIRLLATRTFEDLKGFTGTMASDLNRILANGITDGTGPRVIANQMQQSMAGLTRRRAEVIARTEIIHAHAEGQLDAFQRLGVEELGVLAEFSTAGDNRVCPTCQDLEGETFTIDEARNIIPVHAQCVLGNSFVECPDVFALTRVKYHGRIFNISTQGHRHFSVTENHVLLTANGWRLAKDLQSGDKLIKSAQVDPFFADNPEQDKAISRIEDVFDSIAKMLPKHLGRVARTSPQDFHGDGGSIDQEIDIILADCKLRDKGDPGSFTDIEKLLFISGRKLPQLLIASSPSTLPLKRMAAASDSFMSGLSVPAVLTRRSPAHHKLIGGGLVSETDPTSLQASVNNAAGTSKAFSDLVDALPASVAFDDIRDIQIAESVRGGVFVFDVSSHSSAYSLNGIVSSNCRCTWIPAPPA